MRPQPQPDQNWPMSTQYLNRAKQAALASTGAGHLAPLFGPGGETCRPNRGGPYHPGPKPGQGRQGCANCQQQQQAGCQNPDTLAFTSQLSGLPVPEHPSGAFPNFNYVMVAPQNAGGTCNQPCGGGGGGVGGGGRPNPYFQQQSSPGQQMPWQQGCGLPQYQQQQQMQPPAFSQNQGPPMSAQWPPMDSSNCQCGRCGGGGGSSGGGGMTMTNLF